jgi:hypothetical protein
MGVNKKGGLVGGFDQLRAPDAPTISVAAGGESLIVTITNPTNTGGGDITGYAVSALTGPIEDTTFAVTVVNKGGNKYAIDGVDAVSRLLRFGGRLVTSGNDIVDIRFVTIATLGNEADFGDLTGGRSHLGALSNSTRAVTLGGYNGSSYINNMDYVDPNSTGNASDFGDLTSARTYTSGLANSTRGITGGGQLISTFATINNIDYITIGSTGNASDFGDLTVARQLMNAGASSPTRGMFFGGNN